MVDEMDENGSLLNHYTITYILPCTADPDKLRAIADLSDDIAPVFPYLNGVLDQVVYNPEAKSIMIKHAGCILTLYPRAATLAKLARRSEAKGQLSWFQQLCNETWQRRAEITPCHQRRAITDPVDVYQLLPQLDCKTCGHATCWSFSWDLLFGELSLADCPHLSDPSYAEGGRRLEELLHGPHDPLDEQK